MPAQFENRIKQIIRDYALEKEIAEIFSEARNEFPCLSCPSKDDCNTFKWFLKWFGQPK